MVTLSCPHCHSELELALIPAVEQEVRVSEHISVSERDPEPPTEELLEAPDRSMSMTAARIRIIKVYSENYFTLRGHGVYLSANDLLETAISYPAGTREYGNTITLNTGKATEMRVPARKTLIDTLCKKFPRVDWRTLNITSADAIRVAGKCRLDTNSGTGEIWRYETNGNNDLDELEAARALVFAADPGILDTMAQPSKLSPLGGLTGDSTNE